MFALSGKGKNLRLRFDSSASERTLPQATARRARSDSDELSFPLYSRALCNHLYCYLLARASLSEATHNILPYGLYCYLLARASLSEATGGAVW